MFEKVDLHAEVVKQEFDNFDLFRKAFIDYYVSARRNVADYKLYDSKLKFFPNAVKYVICVESKDLMEAARFLEDFDAFVADSPEYEALSAVKFHLCGVKRVKDKHSGEKVYRIKLSCEFFFESPEYAKFFELLLNQSDCRSEILKLFKEGGEV